MNGSGFGKILIGLGIALVVIGVIFMVGSRLINLGKLPGDIFIQRENFTFYFPVVTCIIVSIVLSVVMNVFRR